MKKILLAFLIIVFSVSYSWAGVASFPGGGVPVAGGESYGCPTCDTDLRCEDDEAASTVVINDGTGADWVAGGNTDGYHSTTHEEGSSSFLLGEGNLHIKSAANWTSEDFEVTFYMKMVDETPAKSEYYWQIGGGVNTQDSNMIHFYKASGTNTQVCLYLRGNEAPSGETRTSTNLTNDTNWHKYTITVDATASPWSVVVVQDSTTLTWDHQTGPTAAAVFGSLMYFSVYAGDYEANAYFDVITVEDKT